MATEMEALRTELEAQRTEAEALREENALLKSDAEQGRQLEEVLIEDQENMMPLIEAAKLLLEQARDSRYYPDYRVDEDRCVMVAIPLLEYAILTAEDREVNPVYQNGSLSAEPEYSPELQKMGWVPDLIDEACKLQREFSS